MCGLGAMARTKPATCARACCHTRQHWCAGWWPDRSPLHLCTHTCHTPLRLRRYFALAEAGSPKAVMDPGYHYCKGIYNRWEVLGDGHDCVH